MRQVEVLDQLLVGGGFLEGVQFLTLDVLDDRLLEDRGVVGVADDRGDGLESDPPGRAPPPLARDELEPVALLPDEHGLEDPHFADRLGQRGERLLVEVLAGLLRVGPDRGGRDLLQARAALMVPVGISAPSPLPSPPGRAITHLLGEFPVGHGTP